MIHPEPTTLKDGASAITGQSPDNLQDNDFYRMLFDHSSAVILVLDSQTGAILDANPAACNFYGYPHDTFISLNISDISHRPGLNVSALLKKTAEGQITKIENTHRLANGELREVEASVGRGIRHGETVLIGTIQDITARKVAEEKLRQSEERYYLQFKKLPTPTYTWQYRDGDFILIDMNNAALGFSAAPTGKPIGGKASTVLDKNSSIRQNLEQCYNTHSTFQHEMDMVLLSDGSRHHATATFNFIEPDLVVIYIQDLTELQQVKDQLERFFDFIPDMVCIASADGYFKQLNNAWERTLGYTKTEIMAAPWDNFIHPDDRQATFSEAEKQFAGKQIAHFINRYRAKDGAYHWFEWFGTCSSDGTELYATAHDITARKEAEEKLLQSEARFSSIFHYSPIGIIIFDSATDRVIDCNDSFLDLTGFTQAEILEKPLTDLNLFINNAEREEWLSALKTSGSLQNIPSTLHKKSGELRYIMASLASLKGTSDNLIVMLCANITEQKRTEASLLLAQTDLEKRVQERTKELSRSFEQLHLATNAAKMGIWDWDLRTNLLVIDNQMYQLYHIQPQDYHGNEEEWLQCIHPEDRQRTHEEALHSIRTDAPYNTEFRVQWEDGSIHWLKTSGQVFRNEQGEPTRMIGVDWDITESKKVESQLKQLAHMLAEGQRLAHLGSFEYIIETRQTVWSDEEFRIYGYDPSQPSPDYETILAKSIHPEDAALLNNTFQTAMQNGSIYELEHRIVRPNGEVRWIFNHADPQFDDHGKLLRYFGVTLDTTERRLAEEQLRQSEEKFSKSFYETPIPRAIMRETDQVFTDVNIEFTNLFGYSHKEAIGHTAQELNLKPSENDLAEIMRLWKSPTGTLIPHIFQINTRSGKHLELMMSYSTITLQGIQYLILDYIDVTEIRLAKEENLRLAERLDIATESAHIGTWDWDVPQNILKWDERNYQVFGIKQEEFEGAYDAWLSRVHPEDRAYCDEAIQQALRGEKDYHIEFRAILPDGTLHWIKADGLVVRNAARQPLRMVGVNYDITEHKLAEQTLAENNLKLNKAIKARENFLAAMSHELRTPLTGILGLTEVLLLPNTDPLTERQHKALSAIQSNGNRLMNLVSNVLNFTELQSGSIPAELTPCWVNTVCETVIQTINPEVIKKKQHFEYTAPKEKIRLLSNEQQLYSLMRHLLENAVKFTPEQGQLGLELSVEPDASQIKITVWDKGIGISEADLPRLFEPFVQLDAGLARHYEGVGLGLVLARQRATLLGGSISVQSTLGQGSRFTLTLPYKKSNSA